MEEVVTVPSVPVVVVVPSPVVVVPSPVVVVPSPAVVEVVVVEPAVSSSGARNPKAMMLMAAITTATARPINQGLGWGGGP
jgi:hypothetical protein